MLQCSCGKPSKPDTLGTEENHRIVMYTNTVFGTAKCVLFINESSFQSVLIKGVSHDIPAVFFAQKKT